MLSMRDEHSSEVVETFSYPTGKKKKNCTLFFGYTSNLVTSGLREVMYIKKLVQLFRFCSLLGIILAEILWL